MSPNSGLQEAEEEVGARIWGCCFLGLRLFLLILSSQAGRGQGVLWSLFSFFKEKDFVFIFSYVYTCVWVQCPRRPEAISDHLELKLQEIVICPLYMFGTKLRSPSVCSLSLCLCLYLCLPLSLPPSSSLVVFFWDRVSPNPSWLQTTQYIAKVDSESESPASTSECCDDRLTVLCQLWGLFVCLF